MLRLRAGTATLLIGPRAAAGVHGSRYCLESEADIRHRLTVSLHDPASREAIRRFWAHWQGDARVSGVKDHSIIDRIARMGVRGPLIVFLITDLSLHRRDTSAARRKQVNEALQTRSRAMPWQGPVRAPAPIKVSMVKPAATQPPSMVDRSVIAAPKRLVGDWTIAERLTAIVLLTADSRKLSDDARQQLKQMLSDPTFLAWLVGSLLVWFVAHFFVVGEVIDMLLAGAALVLGGVGIVMAVQSLVGAAHLIGQFVEATREAKDENDLRKAADILAEIIVMIGITVLIAALTHATTRATSSGLEAKGSVKKPPPARESTADAPLARRGSGSGDSSSGSSTSAANEGGSAAPALEGATKAPSYKYHMIEDPGPLAEKRGNPASNFRSGMYNERVLEEDTIFYRGGDSGGSEWGQWFTSEPPKSVANVRIDSAVKPQWIDPKSGALTGVSNVNTVYAIRIPKGTKIYEGPVGNQGGIYTGGPNSIQIFIEKPQNIKGAEVVGSTPLK